MDYKEIFYKDSVEKQIYITSDDGLICITNNELNMETFELSESLCSDKELTFGKCSAALLKFTVSNVFISMKDKWLTVEITVGGDADRYRIGRYKVYSDKATAGAKLCNTGCAISLFRVFSSFFQAFFHILHPYPATAEASR